MANNEKKGNAFTENPIVRAIGTQKIVIRIFRHREPGIQTVFHNP